MDCQKKRDLGFKVLAVFVQNRLRIVTDVAYSCSVSFKLSSAWVFVSEVSYERAHTRLDDSEYLNSERTQV